MKTQQINLFSDNLTSFKDLESEVRKWLLIDDKFLIKVLVSSVIANRIEGDPFWLFLVAPPGGTKTELLRSLNGLNYIFPLSDLTPQTFISGDKKNQKASLLLQLPQDRVTIITLKDFTSVLSMHQDKQSAILSQLREIFDGYYTKSFGTGVTISWKGKIGLIAGVTSIIDSHYSVYQSLGERFLQYRPQQGDDVELAKRSMSNSGIENEMRANLDKAFKTFIDNVSLNSEVEVNEEIREKIANIATFCARGRSTIIRDNFTREVNLIPQNEVPTRIAKQLLQLYKALYLITPDQELENLQIITKVALDSIPQTRKQIFHLLTENVELSRTEIARITKYPDTSVKRILEDMQCMDLIQKMELSDKNIKYQLSEFSKQRLAYLVF